MTYFEHWLARQAVSYQVKQSLPLKSPARVAIVTCMDVRLNVTQALGLPDAHILRNAGGRVTDDVIRSLVISQQLLGTKEVIVLHHTDCGAMTFTNEYFGQTLTDKLGVDLTGKDFLPFTDLTASVQEDVALLRASPLLPPDILIFGAIYDVATGKVLPVG